MRTTILLGIILALVSGGLNAQGARKNEAMIGLGVTFPKEKDPLNVLGEAEMPTSLIGNVGYRRYVSELAAIGLRAYGTVNTLSDYTVTSTSNPTLRTTDFSLTTYNIGCEGLLLLAEDGHSRPYLSLMVLYSAGVLRNQELGNLRYQGALWGIGLGLRIDLSKTTALSLEGLGCFGSAKWEKKPFVNSISDEYNPSTITFTASLSFSFR